MSTRSRSLDRLSSGDLGHREYYCLHCHQDKTVSQGDYCYQMNQVGVIALTLCASGLDLSIAKFQGLIFGF